MTFYLSSHFIGKNLSIILVCHPQSRFVSSYDGTSRWKLPRAVTIASQQRGVIWNEGRDSYLGQFRNKFLQLTKYVSAVPKSQGYDYYDSIKNK